MTRAHGKMQYALLALWLFSAATSASPQQTVSTATDVLKEIMAIPEQSVPPSLLADSYAIAIIPEVIKVGFVIGGRMGKGVLLVRKGKGSAWSHGALMKLTGGSIGFQFGAQSSDVILVFKSARGVDGLVNGKFTLGADAAVAAGPVGRSVEAATDLQLKAEIYSYSRSRGLFAGVSVEGSALEIDHGANGDYYAAPAISAQDIFSGNKILKVPDSMKRLMKLVSKHTQAR